MPPLLYQPWSYSWPDWSQVQWGNPPTWLAFFAATTAVIFTWRALVRERRRDADREKKEVEAQADKVAAWVEPVSAHGQADVFIVFVRNASDLPIFRVRVTVMTAWHGGDSFEWWLPVLPPGKVESKRLPYDMQANIPLVRAATHGSENYPGYGAVLDFFDMRGKAWRREVNGILREQVTHLKKPARGVPKLEVPENRPHDDGDKSE